MHERLPITTTEHHFVCSRANASTELCWSWAAGCGWLPILRSDFRERLRDGCWDERPLPARTWRQVTADSRGREATSVVLCSICVHRNFVLSAPFSSLLTSLSVPTSRTSSSPSHAHP
eukprot:1351758-Pleurochrysis_carterae.AAC.1